MSERDERWEEMYACISPYMIDLDDGYFEMVKIGVYVWFDGGFYWTEQNLTKDDIKLVDFDLVGWLLDEMVKMTDEYIDEGVRAWGLG